MTLAFGVLWCASARGDSGARHPLLEAVDLRGGNCLSRNDLRQRMRRWLGTDAVDARIVVHVTERPEAAAEFQVIRDQEVIAERRFEPVPGGCGELASALSLAIALAIDSTVLDRMPSDEEPPAVSSPPPPPEPFDTTPQPEAVSAAPSPRSAAPPRISFLIEGSGLFNALPGPTWALYAAAELRLRKPFRLRAGLLGTGEARGDIGPGRVGVRLLTARVDGCTARAAGPFEAIPCLGLGAGQLRARGGDLQEARMARLPWWDAHARFELRMPLSRRFSASLGVEGVAALGPNRLEVLDPAGTSLYVRRLSRFGLRAGIGAAVLGW